MNKKTNILKLIKNDIKSFKWYELLFVSIVGCFLIVIGLYDLTNAKWFYEDIPTWKATIKAFSGFASWTGILTVFLVAKKRLSNYFYGAISTLIYGLFSFVVGYTGDALLNILFFFPFQFIGYFSWKKKMNEKTHETKVSKMSYLDWIITIMGLGLLWLAFYYFIPVADVTLKKMLNLKDVKYPFENKIIPRLLDSFTNAASIIATYLMWKRLKGQWFIWILVNIAQITMYSGINGWGVNVPIIIMWIVFLINALFGLYNWSSDTKIYKYVNKITKSIKLSK